MEAVTHSDKRPKTIVVIGAGPAGLTTAYELLSKSRGLRVVKLEVLDKVSTLSVRVEKAYPAYFDTYDEFPKLREWLDTIPNLYCVGRNGQHRYNNMDHSMCTGFEAARAILAGSSDRTALWNVNTEKEYHESK